MAKKFTYESIIPPSLMPIVALRDTGESSDTDIPGICGLHLLTENQRNILDLTIRGLTPDQIGASLQVSGITVSRTLQDIRNKLIGVD